MQKAHQESQENAMPPHEMEMDNAMPPAQDTVSEYVPESINHPKAGLANAINKAKQTILGSGKIIEEITVVKDTSVDLAKQSILLPASTLVNIVKGHPIKAVRKFAVGSKDNLKRAATLATSPTRLAVAGGATVADLTKKTVKLPFQAAAWVAESPFKVWDMMNKGADKMFNVAKRLDSWNKEGKLFTRKKI